MSDVLTIQTIKPKLYHWIGKTIHGDTVDIVAPEKIGKERWLMAWDDDIFYNIDHLVSLKRGELDE